MCVCVCLREGGGGGGVNYQVGLAKKNFVQHAFPVFRVRG